MGKDSSSEEKLVHSLWHKRWRADIWAKLPREYDPPASWTSPKVVDLCFKLWKEITDHVCRTEAEEPLTALSLFVADEATQAAGKEWCYVPGADFLLMLGEGFVGVTAEGVFACGQGQDPPPMPVNFDVESLRTELCPVPVAPGAGQASAGVGQVVSSIDRLKVVVRFLTAQTTLEMLTGYFAAYGPITDAVVMADSRLPKDKLTGKPRGFGFVVFETMQMVEACLADYAKHRIDGKWVEVKRAVPLPEPMAPTAGGPALGHLQGPVTVSPPLRLAADQGGAPPFASGGLAMSVPGGLTVPPPAAPMRTFAEQYDPVTG